MIKQYPKMILKLRFFAQFRESIGHDQMEIEVQFEQITVRQLQDHLIQQGEPWSSVFREQKVFYAVNAMHCDSEHCLHHGDEVAFYPMVTGG